MSRRLRFSSWALLQLESGLDSFDDRAAASKVARTIEQRMRNLKTTPRAGRKVPELDLEDLREVIVQPFRIVYRIEPREIRVLAVVHLRRDLVGALPPPRSRK